MANFVVESRRRKIFSSEQPEGFVAESRPSSRQRRHDVHSSTMYHQQTHLKTSSVKGTPNDGLDVALNDILSQRSFSTNQLKMVIKTSIVQLINTLLNGHGVSSIQGCINVCLGGRGQPITVDLDESYGHAATPSLVAAGGDEKEEEDAMASRIKRKDVTMSPVLTSPVHDDRPCPGEFGEFASFGHYGDYTLGCPSRESPSPESPPLGGLEDRGLDSPFYRHKSEASDKESEVESGYCESERGSLSDASADDLVDTTSDRRVLKEMENSSAFTERRDDRAFFNSEDMDTGEPELVIDLSVPSGGHADTTSDIADASSKNYSEEKMAYTSENIDHQKDMEIGDVLYLSRNESPILEVEKMTDDIASEPENTVSSFGSEVPIDLSGDSLVTENLPPRETQDTGKSGEMKSTELTCKKCPALLSDTAAYQDHALQCHQQYACSTCFKDFSSKNNLKRHVRIHTGLRPYKCGQCDMTFARRDDLKGHTLKHDYSKPFRCSLCRKGYTDRACVKNHMSKEHCSRLMHICPQCGESFDRDETFLEHKKTHPALQQFACKTCPFVGINHLMAMKHQLLHSHKLFSCKPCNAYFADPFSYTKHVRKHKKDTAYNFYVCCFCDITLTTYEQFVRHEYSHAQGKLHECETCKKQFRSKSMMLEHSLAHSNSNSSTNLDDVMNDSDDNTLVDETHTDIVEEIPTPSPMPETNCTPPEIQSCHAAIEMDVPSVSDDKRDNDEFSDTDEGKLLDLSLKPARPVDNYSKERNVFCAAKSTIEAGRPSLASSRFSSNCAPRNGCATLESRDLVQGRPTVDCTLAGYQTNSPMGDEYQVVWKSPSIYEDKVDVTESKRMNFLEVPPQIPTTLYPNGQDAASQLKETPRLVSRPSGHHTVNPTSSRVHTYSKSKIMDLASKFVAARGKDRLLKLHSEMPLTNRHSLVGAKVKQSLTNRQSVQQNCLPFDVSNFETERECSPVNDIPKDVVFGLSGRPCVTQSSLSHDSSCRMNSRETSPVLKHSVKPEDYTPLPPPITASSSDASPSSDSDSSPSQKQLLPAKSMATSPTGVHKDCDICSASFESFFQLESHSVVVHNRYLCEFCGKGFTARPNRDRHVRYHTGERPYKCDLCPSAFCRGDDLKYHRTTRHPTEQFACGRCTASFTWRKDLEKHMRHSKCVVDAC